MRAAMGRVRRRKPPPKSRNPVALAGAHGADWESYLDCHPFTLNRVRLQRLAIKIHCLGPRALYELLLETLERPAGDFFARLETYASLNPDQLRIVGSDRFPPAIFAAGDGR